MATLITKGKEKKAKYAMKILQIIVWNAKDDAEGMQSKNQNF
jgi:hypothetical protein